MGFFDFLELLYGKVEIPVEYHETGVRDGLVPSKNTIFMVFEILLFKIRSQSPTSEPENRKPDF